MTNYQKNRLTMYQAVLRFFREEGAPLAAIKLIGEAAGALGDIAGRIGDAQEKQDQPTTGVTATRKQTKASAAQKAEVLRQLVRALTPDATLRAALDTPVAEMLLGKDADFVRYLGRIGSAVATLPAQLLTDAGYDPQVRQGLETQRQALTDTQG